MADPLFRLVCRPAALAETPRDWAREMLRDGQIALIPTGEGLPAVDAVAHQLGLTSLTVVRGEQGDTTQAETVIAFANSMPLVWIDAAFDARVNRWAQERGPMTLLVTADGPLGADDRARIARFAATLGRQSE